MQDATQRSFRPPQDFCKTQNRTGSLAQFLRSSDPGFAERFKALADARRDQPQNVQDAVRAIIGAVREKGDAAVLELTARFDGAALHQTGLAFPAQELEQAYNALAPDLKSALMLAYERIEDHHRRQ